MGGEIVSADSRLFYRGMDIGTAKPSREERRRVSHHLIDVADPDESWSLAVFQREAARTIREVQSRGKLPFLVGGTGQYVRAVVEDWQPPAQHPDPRLRQILEGWAGELGGDALHHKLALLDPAAGEMIDASNVRRTVRALEVILHTGRRFSDQRTRGEPSYDLLMVGLIRPRVELYTRIDARIEAMFAAGLVAEVQDLLAQGYSAELPTLSAIGYREVTAYLRGEMSLDEAKILMKRATRRYVRQQSNWFRLDDPRIHWFQVSENTVGEVISLVRNWLEGEMKRDA
jgi:tRNA dimethylallyltransferase